VRHLVVCCDGTWNAPEQQRQGVLAPTNVVRLYHSLHRNNTQLRYYHSGAGTDRGLLNRPAHHRVVDPDMETYRGL
jgi:uncharacterized protein (DUF2235 family)